MGFGCVKVPNPDPYRGILRGRPDVKAADLGTAYASYVKRSIDYDTSGMVAGFWAEPIQGVGGSVTMVDVRSGVLRSHCVVTRRCHDALRILVV